MARDVVDVVKRLSAALEPGDVVLGGGNVHKLKKRPTPVNQTMGESIQIANPVTKKETTMQIGMVGLGRMGADMVRRLINDGHQCVVFNRSPQM